MAEITREDADAPIQLAVANHYGTHIKSGQPVEDAATSGLFMSRKMPGAFFVARSVKPGHVADPDRLGKRRKLNDEGVYGITGKEAWKWLRNHGPQHQQLRAAMRRSGVDQMALLETLRGTRGFT
jgi:hypothetical protein